MKPTLIERMRVLRGLVRAALRLHALGRQVGDDWIEEPITPQAVTAHVVRLLAEARSENPTVRFPDHAAVLRAMAHLELEELGPKGGVH